MSRSSAFISTALRRRPARTLPWHAMVESTWSRRSETTRLPSPSANSSARSCISPWILAWPSSAGTSRTTNADAPKLSITRPRRSRSSAAATSPSGSLGVKLDDFRDQQHLPGKPAGEGPLQTLIDEALMGRVLIDDDKRIFRLGDDERV